MALRRFALLALIGLCALSCSKPHLTGLEGTWVADLPFDPTHQKFTFEPNNRFSASSSIGVSMPCGGDYEFDGKKVRLHTDTLDGQHIENIPDQTMELRDGKLWQQGAVVAFVRK